MMQERIFIQRGNAFVLGIFLCSSAIACKKEVPKLSPPQTGSAEQVSTNLSIRLDHGLSEKERKLFLEDISFLENITLKAEADSYFYKTFYDGEKINILKFVDERVGYIIGSNASTEERFGFSSAQGTQGGRAVTIATNIGTAIWLDNLTQKRAVDFFVNDGAIPVTDPRIGIIRLAEGYTNFDGNGNPMNTVARTSVLLHEARHSDCTGGLSKKDVLNLSVGEPPENKSCGHLHVICADGDYKGLPACDSQDWGAYSIGYLYASGLYDYCDNCNEAMRQTAKAVAIDSILRVGKPRALAIIDKKLPPPDLSSDATVP